MTVGDIIQVTNIATGETHVAHIVHGSSSAGIYGDDRGMSWWASGVQWTRTIGPHQTAPKTHTCTVIKTAEQVPSGKTERTTHESCPDDIRRSEEWLLLR